MYIKAKYPKIGHEDYSMGVQGFGSLYGGNHSSVVENEPTSHEVVNDSSNPFPYEPWEFSVDFSNDFKIKI